MADEIKQAQERIDGMEFQDWRGFPACRRSDLRAHWPAIGGDTGSAMLGDPPAPAFFEVISGAGGRELQVWLHDDDVLKIDIDLLEVPLNTETWSAQLGQPEARLDHTFDMMVIEKGQWVFASRGITLFWNPDGDVLTGLSVYAPTTVKDYETRLAPWTDYREFPES